MRTTTKVQTAFRLDTALLSRLKRKAKARGQSLNSYVEGILMNDSPREPQLPKIPFPLEESEFTKALHLCAGNGLTQELIDSDERIQHILGLDHD